MSRIHSPFEMVLKTISHRYLKEGKCCRNLKLHSTLSLFGWFCLAKPLLRTRTLVGYLQPHHVRDRIVVRTRIASCVSKAHQGRKENTRYVCMSGVIDGFPRAEVQGQGRIARSAGNNRMLQHRLHHP